jgi:hypothetical protein
MISSTFTLAKTPSPTSKKLPTRFWRTLSLVSSGNPRIQPGQVLTQAKLGGGQGRSGPYANAVGGHLQHLWRHGAETLRQGHPRRCKRRKRANGVTCCRVDGLEAAVALHRHLGGDTGVVLGYLAKMDRLYRLALRGDQLLLDG